jgi:hypothetical protein
LTKNWSAIIQHNLQQPETVIEAVNRLMMVLDGEQKIAVATMREEDLIALHFNLGYLFYTKYILY